MMYRVSNEDLKKLEDIQAWMTFDASGNLVFKEGTPRDIINEKARIDKTYTWLE